MPDQQDNEVVIPLCSEELTISKQVNATARVAVTRRTREHSALVDETLAQETVDISRQQIGRYVESMPAVREEGDTIIVPVVEERLVVERRLFLKEEVRVRRVRGSKPHQELVTLRHHEVVVNSTPVPPPPGKPAADHTHL